VTRATLSLSENIGREAIAYQTCRATARSCGNDEQLFGGIVIQNAVRVILECIW
jgi:hypothetical protein